MDDPSETDAEGVSAERIEELEARIEDLSRELRSPSRGPLGLPRPPTPGELLRLAEENAIPTAIAVLEANIRALRLLQETIRLVRRTEDGDLRGRADSVAREAMSELDRAVTDLREAIEGGGLPDDQEARSVLREIRDVREEVAAALDTNGSGRDDGEGAERPGGQESELDDDSGTTEIDVESELESIREEVREETPDEDGDDDEE